MDDSRQFNDPEEAARLRDEGIARAAAARAYWLPRAVQEAYKLARKHPDSWVNAHQVQDELLKDPEYRPIPDPKHPGQKMLPLGNAAGAIFAGEEFTNTGKFARGTRPSTHARRAFWFKLCAEDKLAEILKRREQKENRRLLRASSEDGLDVG